MSKQEVCQSCNFLKECNFTKGMEKLDGPQIVICHNFLGNWVTDQKAIDEQTNLFRNQVKKDEV